MPDHLDHYLQAFRSLNVNRARGRVSPHKPCMLLAVLGLAEAGDLERNEIRFEPALLQRYAKYFDVVRGPTDHPNPYFPFFHLRGDGFWHHQALSGREAFVAAMESARSNSAIAENIDHARLDPELYVLVLDERSRAALREELVVAWFGSHRKHLDAIIQEERGSYHYEAALRHGAASTVLHAQQTPPEPVRSAAFRRIVSETYDYRCAASGWRIILPDSRCMVEAAHLIPFAESHDDDPRNGIALAPSFHWALDAHVIAPGPDHQWYVSRALDERVADNQPLLALAGTSLMLPKDRTFWPKEEALEWRLAHLLEP
jgi:putative restriction endonuclease